MPSVHSRRTRFSYSSELERSSVVLENTPIEKVSATKQPDGVADTSNIRFTPYSHERTDYTYADSGSYRTDRLKNQWTSPNMSRLPIHSTITRVSTTTITNGLNHKDTSDDMYSKVLSKRLNAATAIRSSQEDAFDEVETSSRGSRASSRSSTRLLRVRCLVAQGEWCSHSQCRKQRASLTTSHQRNTNNSNSVDAGDGSSEPDNSASGKPRRSRRGPRASLKTAVNTPVRPSPSMNGTSSTYVYTYMTGGSVSDAAYRQTSLESGDGPGSKSQIRWDKRPSMDTQAVVNRFRRSAAASETNSAPRSWITRNIFGLENGSNQDDSVHRFASSDVDEADTMVGSTLFSRRAAQHSLQTSTRVVPRSSIGRTVRSISETGLLLLLTLCYGCYKLINWAIGSTFSCCQKFAAKVFSPTDSCASEKLALHPRLTQFDSPTTTTHNASNMEEQDLVTSSARTVFTGLWGLRPVFWRLIGLLCLLVPLLCLLAFLFAPVALDDADDVAPHWPTFPAASECKQVLGEALSSNASAMQIAYWRFRCLYQVYFLTPDTANHRPDAGQSTTWFGWFATWFTRPVTANESFSWKPEETHVTEQLSQFSRLIDQRLNQLARTLKLTDNRLSDVELQSEKRINTLVTQLHSLQTTLDKHVHSLDAFRSELASSQTTITLNSTANGLSDDLVQTILSVVNRTIVSKLHTIRVELEQVHWSQAQTHNETVNQLHVLLTHLRQQMMQRMQDAEEQLLRLNTAFREELGNQSSKHVSLLRLFDELRTNVNQLDDRLSQLKQTQADWHNLIGGMQQAIRQCSEQQTQQVERCQQVAATSAQRLVSELSDKLRLQLNEMVEEVMLKQLDRGSQTSTVRLQLEELAQKAARDVVDKVLTDKSLKLDTSLDHHSSLSHITLKRLIEEALDKFAADRTGRADFALESAGGSIVGTRCTRTYTEGAALFSIFGIPLARLSNSPRIILQPSNNPGDCWPFHGSSGQAVIRLSSPVVVTAVSLEHLARALAPNGRLDSAPREFQLKGLKSAEDEEGIVLGSFVYNIDGPPIQTFEIQNQTATWHFVELSILSNHGHPSYTCVYRLRVHGNIPAA